MFIGNFNRFFEKHGKKTYIILGIIISAMFVVFVTPGQRSGCDNPNKLGEIYGKAITTSQILPKMNETIISIWIENPQLFGYELGLSDKQLLQLTLHNMRRMKLAESYEIPAPSDERMLETIKSIPIFQDDNHVFNQEIYKNILAAIQNKYGIDGKKFDQILSDTIRMKDLESTLTADITVSDDEIASYFTAYTLCHGEVTLDPKDSTPSDEEVIAYFNANKDNLAGKMPYARNAKVAVFSIANTIARAQAADAPEYLAPLAEELKDTTKDQKAVATKFIQDQARGIRTKFDGKQVKDEPLEKRIQRFTVESARAGASVCETGLLLPSDKITCVPSINNLLSTDISHLKNLGDITPVSASNDTIAVAMLIDQQQVAVPAEVTAENMGMFKDLIIRDNAMAYFNTSLKAPFETAVAQAAEIAEDQSLTNDEKQEKLVALDAQLPQAELNDFFIPPQRDYAYATIPFSAFTDNQSEITDAMIEDAFNAMPAEEGKTLENSRDEIIASIRKDQATEIASAKATQIFQELDTAWWESKRTSEGTPDGAAILKAAAAKISQNITVNEVKAEAENDISATPNEVKQVIFQATEKTPLPNCIYGKDAVYVACLLSVSKPSLKDPNTDVIAMQTLVAGFRRNQEMKAAEVRAEKLYNEINKKLAEGGDITTMEITFSEAKPFMQAGIMGGREETIITINNMRECHLSPMENGIFDLLATTPVNTLLAPRAYTDRMNKPSGYVLIYMAAKEVKIAEADEKLVSDLKNQLLESHKRKLLANVYGAEEANSNTVLKDFWK